MIQGRTGYIYIHRNKIIISLDIIIIVNCAENLLSSFHENVLSFQIPDSRNWFQQVLPQLWSLLKYWEYILYAT